MRSEEGRTEERLRCELSAAELEQRAQDIARVCADVDQVDEQRKLAASEYRDRLKELKLVRSTLAAELREKATRRDVVVETSRNLAAGSMDSYRSDTHELVRSRPLDPHERQGTLFKVEPSAPPEAEPAPAV